MANNEEVAPKLVRAAREAVRERRDRAAADVANIVITTNNLIHYIYIKVFDGQCNKRLSFHCNWLNKIISFFWCRHILEV